MNHGLLHKLNAAFFCDPSGDYSAAKIMSSIFQWVLLVSFWRKADQVLQNWDILALFIAAFIAPDILKKVITMKFSKDSSMNNNIAYTQQDYRYDNLRQRTGISV